MRRYIISALIAVALFIAQPLAACAVIQDWVKRGGQQVTVGYMKSTNFWLQSYPGASITVLQVGTQNNASVFKDSGCSVTQPQPFFADSTGYFQVYTGDAQDDLQFSGGGLTGTVKYTYTAAPVVGNFITQSQGDARYLRLTGGTLAGAGNLTVGGTLGVTGISTHTGLATFNGGILDTAGITTRANPLSIAPTTLNLGAVLQQTNATTGFNYLTGVQTGGSKDWVINDAQNTRTPFTLAFSNGLITIANGLTVTGTTTTGVLNAGAITGTSYTGGPISGTTGTFSSNVSMVNLTATGTAAITGSTTITANLGVAGASVGADSITTGVAGGGATGSSIKINGGDAAGDPAILSLQKGAGTALAIFGIRGASSRVTGDALNDFNLYTTNRVNLSANGGTNRQAILVAAGFGINGTGAATNTDPVFPLQVKGQGTNQIVAEYDATHRASLWADATNAYSGSTVAIPYKLRSNNTDALTIDTSQNLTAASEIGIGQTPTARLVVGAGGVSATAEEARIDAGSGAGGDAFIGLYRNSVNKAKLGIAGSASDLLTGSSANDLNIVNSQAINVSANGSAAIQLILTSAGQLGIGSASPNFPLHIRSSSSPQVMAEFDGTHRTALGNDGTNGFSGTTTGQPYKLRTNNTDAVTLDTSQNANFAGAVGLNDATAAYPFSTKKNGTACTGAANNNCIASIFDSTNVWGVFIGYNSVTNSGVLLGPNINGYSLDLYTRGGVAYNKALSLVNGGAAFGGKVTSYNGYTTVGFGMPSIVGAVNLTAQTASVGTTTLFTTTGVNATNYYRLCWTQTITTAATSSSSLLTTLGWTNTSGVAKTTTISTDVSAGTTQTTADATNALGSERSYCTPITLPSLAGTNVTYATAYSTSGATVMQYALRVILELLQ